ERGGRWNLYVAELVNEHESTFFNATEIDEKPILVAAADAYQPQYSSDGAEIAFLEDGRTLRVLNLASHQIRTIAPVAITADILSHDQRSYRWSPDGRWFLVHFVPPGHRSLELGLIRSDGHGELINVTLSGYNDVFPKWVMGGQVMIWASDRDAPRGEVWAGNWQGDVYAQFMTRWAWDLYRFGAQQGQAGGAPAATIEIEGLRDRRLRLTPRSSGLTDAVIPPNGSQLLYLARLGKGIDLWTTQRSGETRLLARLNAQQASHLTLTADGEHVVMLADGEIAVVSTRSGELHRIPFQAELEVDVAAERAYLYDHVSRQVERIFYDRQLHGVDWDFYVAEYAGFLPHLGGEREFARLLDELLGELNASHCGARSKRRSGNGDRTAALGLFFAETGAGPGLRITGVMAANPVLHAGSRIRTGVVIEAVDGHPIAAGANFYPLLNRQVGKPPFDGASLDNGPRVGPSQRLRRTAAREKPPFDEPSLDNGRKPAPRKRLRSTAASEKPLVLALRDPTSGESWQEVVHPIGLREERQLLYRRWVEGRRRTVEELSNRRLGYIHVRRMDEASCRTVVEEVLGRYPEAEGLVVDTRFNSGGYVLDDLLVFLSGTTYLEYVLPDGRKLGMEPQQRWGRPSILVAGKSNYSGAHCLAWSYQHFGIGKVVGTPVPGTCTPAYAEKLLDGTSVNLPMTALAPPDGMPLENVQLEPDVRIENDPSQLAAGRDQQLERAVEELLREIDGPMKG
ncbi:MAG: hypothetical protein GY856_29990, partial [bacterium]|nr:hypothetical protein [bacterium]